MTLLTQSITGIAAPIYITVAEMTDQAVAQAFTAASSPLINIFQRQSLPATGSLPATINPPITSSDVNAVVQGINFLLEGSTVGFQSSSGGTAYLTSDMATSLDEMVRSLVAAGATITQTPIYATDAQGNTLLDGNGNPIPVINPVTNQQMQISSISLGANPINTLTNWKDFSIQSPDIQNVLQDVANTQATNHSLQAVLETVYVKEANDLIQAKLSNLQTALQNATDIQNVLSTIQTLHNDINIPNRPVGNFNYTASNSHYISNYLHYASQQFGQQLTVQIAPNLLTNGVLNTAGLAVVSQLTAAATKLSAELIYLNSPSLIGASQRVGGTLSGLPNSQTVWGQLNAVLQDIKKNFTSNPDKQAGLTAWLTDNYNSGTTSTATPGLIQQNIGFAIAGAQTFSDNQKTAVKQFMFIFQEYYQSASSMLQAITQLIQKIAQHIAS